MNVTRKFFLACFFAAGSFTLTLLGHLSGTEWVSVVTLILGVYGTANVVDKKLGGAG